MSIIDAAEVKIQEDIPGIKERVLMDDSRGTVAVTMGDMLMEPGSHLPLHTHPVEEVFYIFAGHGLAMLGDDERPVGPGTAVLAAAGVPHGFRNPTDTPLQIIFMHPSLNPPTTFLPPRPG